MGIQIRRPIDPAKFARNGKYPDAAFQSDIASTFNHLARYRLKEIARFGMNFTSVREPASSSAEPRWRTRYRVSPHAMGVVFVGHLALADIGHLSPSDDPYALCEILDPVSGLGGVGELHYGAASTSDATPDACAALFTRLRESGDPQAYWTPTPGELYDVTVSDVQSRIASCSIYEISAFAGPIVAESVGAGTPVLDTDRSDIVTSARLMWKHQAAPLLHWTVDDQGVPRTTTSSTAKSLIDNSSTTASSATPGYTLDLRNRNRISSTTVPCVISVYGSSTDEGTVEIRDSSNTVIGSVAVHASLAWHEEDLLLPATLAKYDLMFSSAPGETTSIYAVTIRQYQSGT